MSKHKKIQKRQFLKTVKIDLRQTGSFSAICLTPFLFKQAGHTYKCYAYEKCFVSNQSQTQKNKKKTTK